MNLSVAFDAFAVAMRAKAGQLDPLDVDQLVAAAGDALTADDPLARAITHFATQHQLLRRDPAALAELGQELSHAVDLALIPVPPGCERADIHG